jgi:AraC family transcriptional regulator
MTTSVRRLASGKGWHANDVVCSAGPRDRPFEEQHRTVCVAIVTDGSFRYRSVQGTAMLAPGALLLGNQGTCFECGHEHGRGDRCLSFHYDGDFFERVLAALPGARRITFAACRVPPTPALARLVADAEALREEDNADAFGEMAMRLAGAAATLLAGDGRPREPSSGDERRVAAAIRRIEDDCDGRIALDDLAREVGLSPYHFLRTFRAVAGMTPYQYVLRTRLHRAAIRLRVTSEQVSTIALEAGFNDLSTFNRRFKRIMGSSPQVYRGEKSSRGRPADGKLHFRRPV